MLVSWGHVPGIRAHPPGEGLDAYLRSRPGGTVEVPVAAPGILRDLDTPEEYEELRRSWPS